MLEDLQRIKKIEAREDLYQDILLKIQEPKKKKVSAFQVKVIAAILIAVISIEILMVSQNLNSQETQSTESLVTVNNNMLYDQI